MVGLEYKSDEEAELRRMSVSKDARRQVIPAHTTAHGYALDRVSVLTRDDRAARR
jgi:hypothetical protein